MYRMICDDACDEAERERIPFTAIRWNYPMHGGRGLFVKR